MSEVLREIPYKIEKSEGMNPFWEGLNNNELKTTECTKCSSLHYPPSPVLCPKCFGTEMIWKTLPSTGTVTTFTHVTAPPAGFHKPYFLASVKIDELDKSILGRIYGDNITIGDRVKLLFEKIGDQSVFVFQLDTS